MILTAGIHRIILVASLLAGPACVPAPAVTPTPPPRPTATLAPPPPAPPPDDSVGAEFGGQIRLRGVRLTNGVLVRGQPFELWLYWRSTAPISGELRAFVELLDASSDIVASDDDVIGTRANPTGFWAVGDQGEHVIRPGVAPRANPGPAILRVGVLAPDRRTRLPLTLPDGLNATATWVEVADLRIE